MLIAQVIGEVVATHKHASHHGRKILMVQPLNLDGSDRGVAVVALDSVDAGVGDRVLLTTEGYSAMTSVGRPNSPIDTAVIGVIDCIDLAADAAGSGARTSGPALPDPFRGNLPGRSAETLVPPVPVKQKPSRKH